MSADTSQTRQEGSDLLSITLEILSLSYLSGCSSFPLLKKSWSKISVALLCLALAAWNKTFELQQTAG